MPSVSGDDRVGVVDGPDSWSGVLPVDASIGDEIGDEPAQPLSLDPGWSGTTPGDGDAATATPDVPSIPNPPSWFDQNAFTKPAFCAQTYVDDMSAFVAPDALREELFQYQAKLRAQLLSAVNQDYETFLSLSDGLVDVASVVRTMESPVEEFKTQVMATKDEVVSLLNEMNDRLRERRENAEQKATLELMLDANNVASKVERLLGQLREGGGGDGTSACLAPKGNGASLEKNNDVPGFTWKGPSDGGGDVSCTQNASANEYGDAFFLDETSVAAFESRVTCSPFDETSDDLFADLLLLRVEETIGPSAVVLALAEEERHVSNSDRLKQNLPGTATQNNDLDKFRERCRLLARVACETNRGMSFFQRKGGTTPFMRQLKPRVEAATKQVCEFTKSALKKACATRDAIAITRCLDAFCELGVDGVTTALELIRNERVAPAVRGAIAGAGDGSSSTDFGKLLEKCLRAAVGSIDVELSVTSGNGRDDGSTNSQRRFSLLSECVLFEVDKEIAVAVPSAYTPGVPDAFLANFKQALAGLDFLESRLNTKTALTSFRESDVLPLYLKRWNVSAYFALRRREILDLFENDLEGDRLTAAVREGKGHGTRFNLLATASTYKALAKCFDDKVFTERATDKFAKLAGSILAMFGGWVVAGANWKETKEQAGEGRDDAKEDTDSAESSLTEKSWGESASDEDFLLLRGDIEVLAGLVDSQLTPRAEEVVLKSLGRDAATAVAQVLREGTQFLLGSDSRSQSSEASETDQGIYPDEKKQIGPARTLDRRIVASVVTRAAAALTQLKGITATFRMTNKPLPNKPSVFASGVLRPLFAFHETVRNSHQGDRHDRNLSETARQDLVTLAVSGVCSLYKDAAADLLSSVKKTEASLNRLKDRKEKGNDVSESASRSGTASDGNSNPQSGAPTDSEKIVRQVRLDLQAFAVGVGKMGVDLADNKEFAALWAVAGEGEPIESVAGLGNVERVV